MALNKKYTRLTEALSWQALKDRYFIGTMSINGKAEKINQLTEAIENGELDALVKECADALHDGDVYSVYTAWSRVLSSMQTNLKKSYRPGIETEWTRYKILREYVSARMEALKGAARGGNSKAYWQWTIEEIEAVPLTDLRTLKSVYDSMASKKSKYPDLIEEIKDFDARYSAAAARYSAAKKLAKQKEQTPSVEVDEALLAKLSSGNKAVLSAKEAAQLAEILKKLSK